MPAAIGIDQDLIAEFCKRHSIVELALFGSVLREDFGPDSDIDVLVTFAPNRTPGFVRLHHIENELSEFLGGRHLDLVTKKFLNHRIRSEVLADAEVLYEEG